MPALELGLAPFASTPCTPSLRSSLSSTGSSSLRPSATVSSGPRAWRRGQLLHPGDERRGGGDLSSHCLRMHHMLPFRRHLVHKADLARHTLCLRYFLADQKEFSWRISRGIARQHRRDTTAGGTDPLHFRIGETVSSLMSRTCQAICTSTKPITDDPAGRLTAITGLSSSTPNPGTACHMFAGKSLHVGADGKYVSSEEASTATRSSLS